MHDRARVLRPAGYDGVQSDVRALQEGESVESESEWDFNEECRDDFYANLHCAASLTCEEYIEYYRGTPGHACEAEKEARFEMVNKGCFGT